MASKVGTFIETVKSLMPNYGMNVNAQDLNSMFGTPVNAPVVPRQDTVALKTVALGYSVGEEASQLPGGMSSRGSNFLDVDGGLIPRQGLRVFGNGSGTTYWSLQSAVSQIVTWIGEGHTGGGTHVPLALSGKHPAIYTSATDSWSTLSQVGPAGLSGNTLSTVVGSADVKHFDAISYYHPVSDQFEVCFVHSQASGGAYTWRPGTTLFSTLTNSPVAGLVCAFDSRLVFSRISSAGTLYTQRVAWSARGDPETYTAPNGGFEELLDAQGNITRLINDHERVLVFFDNEIWQGIKYSFPFAFQFIPVTRAVGCQAPKSIVQSPKGTIFLGSDFNLYLIPRGGAPQAIGNNLRRLLQSDFNYIEWSDPETVRVYGQYDETRGGYLLLYDGRTSGTQHGLWVNMTTGVASPLDVNQASGWQVRALGETRLADSTVTTVQKQRIIVSGNGSRRFAAEWTSEVSSEINYGPGPLFSLLTATPILNERWTTVPNDDPTTRMHLRELRLDYRAGSSSSASLFQSGDFGQTIFGATALGLPANPFSAQTVTAGGLSAIYPSVKLAVSGFTDIALQGLTAVVESVGNG